MSTLVAKYSIRNTPSSFGSSTILDHLLSYYSFDTANGTTTSWPADWGVGASFAQVNSGLGAVVPGYYSNAIKYVNVVAPSTYPRTDLTLASVNANTNVFSLSFWLNTSDAINDTFPHPLFEFGSTTGKQWVRFGLKNGKIVCTFAVVVGDTGPSFTSVKTVSDSVNHSIVLTFSGTVASLYIDGALDSTANFTRTSVLYNVVNVGFPSDMSSNPVTLAIVDEVGIWTKTLTLTEVQYIYNSTSDFRAYMLYNLTVLPLLVSVTLDSGNSLSISSYSSQLASQISIAIKGNLTTSTDVGVVDISSEQNGNTLFTAAQLQQIFSMITFPNATILQDF